MCGRDGTDVSCEIARRACNSNYSDFHVSTRAEVLHVFSLQRKLPDLKAKKYPIHLFKNSRRNINTSFRKAGFLFFLNDDLDSISATGNINMVKLTFSFDIQVYKEFSAETLFYCVLQQANHFY